VDSIVPVLAAVLPSLGVGALFWLAMRALMNADRSERMAMARMDAAERGRADSDEAEQRES
jgi:hypothetical protein